MKLPTLYEIATDYREALEVLMDMELPDEAIQDTLEGLKGNLETKMTNVGMYVRNLEAISESIKEAEQKMSHRRKVLENRASSIRDYIKVCMDSAGMTKISCPYFELSIKKNTPKVVINDRESIPVIYFRIPELPPPEPDKKAIAEALKKGETVDGVYLEQTTRLDIK